MLLHLKLSKYDITLQIPDAAGPERVISISGKMASAMDAIEEIVPKIQRVLPHFDFFSHF